MTLSEQGKLGTNPGGTPEDAVGGFSPQSSGSSPQHTVSMERGGLSGWLLQTSWLPILAQAPGGQHLGPAVLWLARGKPQPTFWKAEPCCCRALCTGPSCSGTCKSVPSTPLGARICFWSPAWALTPVLAKMHVGLSQQSQVPELLPCFSAETGSGPPGGIARGFPSPRVQAWRRQFQQRFGSDVAPVPWGSVGAEG